MIEVRPVLHKKDLKAFIMLPFRLYKNDPCWVAPLISEQWKFFNPKKNPYYAHSEVMLFLAWEGTRVVGRISAQTNTQHNIEHNDKIGFFGFFECEDHHEAANALFAAAYEWNRYRDRDAMRGPMNFSVNQECGLLIDGFNTDPYVMMTHNLPYYQKLYESYGLSKAMDLYAFHSHCEKIPERVEKAALLIQKRFKCDIRSISKRKNFFKDLRWAFSGEYKCDKASLAKSKNGLKQDIETVFRIYTKAWEYNWGNVPMTDAEFEHIVEELLPIADTDLVFIAEVDGKPAGFSLALPNYNEVLKVMHGRLTPITLIKALIAKQRIKSARVITMGVIKEYQNRGIDTLFYYHSYKNGLPKGFYDGEFSWVLETNTMMLRVAEMLSAARYKTYRLYDKSISS